MVQIIACDSGDPLAVESAFHSLSCKTQMYVSSSAWLERHRMGVVTPVDDTPDIVALVGSSLVVVGNDLVAEVRRRFADTKTLLVLTDPSFGAAAAALKQGVHAVAPHVAEPQALALELHWLVGSARTASRGLRENAHNRVRFSTLTKAELLVLQAMLDGKANKQIADLLGIGLRTVELRRSKIMRKMEAGNLAQLIRFVCQALGPACAGFVGLDLAIGNTIS